MYYWTDKTNTGTSLIEELLNYSDVKHIYIATAFISIDGVHMLKSIKDKYKLKPEKINLYLSDEFSSKDPDILLDKLKEICIVKIVKEKKLHAKVYILKSSKNAKIIFGSSNFTSNGFSRNLEFNTIYETSNNEYLKYELFFNECERRSVLVTKDTIQYYKKIKGKLQALYNKQQELKKLLQSFEEQHKPFEESDYDLRNYYFQYEDYEVFFSYNQKRSNIEIDKQRKEIQSKMLAIHKRIYSKIKPLRLNCHWKNEHITSLITPCEYNRGKVNWLGVRYGKTKAEIDILNIAAEDSYLGFQKHGCLQFVIGPTGFAINLFLAVRNDAIDREYLHENIDKIENDIILCLKNLKGNGYKWLITDDDLDKPFIFDIDASPPTDFITFFKENDITGRESFLEIFYEPDDSRIKNIDSIEKEVIYRINELIPLYNTVVYRIPENMLSY